MNEPKNSSPTAGSDIPAELLRSIRAIETSLQQLTVHPLLTTNASTSRQLVLQFLKGAAFGLGSVIGASVVVSVIVYLLSLIDFVPIIGDLVKSVTSELQK